MRPSPPPSDRLLTVREVGRVLPVSRPTLYRWCREHGVYVGRRLLIPAHALEALIARAHPRIDQLTAAIAGPER